MFNDYLREIYPPIARNTVFLQGQDVNVALGTNATTKEENNGHSDEIGDGIIEEHGIENVMP